MANKTISNPSLSSILAGKGITAKPGVSSGGNKAASRAQAFQAGKTYTPANSGRITQQQGPNRAGSSNALLANHPQMRLANGPGRQAYLSTPMLGGGGGQSTASHQPFPPSRGAVMPSRGPTGSMPAFTQMPPGVFGPGASMSPANNSMPPNPFGGTEPLNNLAMGSRPSAMLDASPRWGAPTDFATGDSQRWGSLGSQDAPAKPAMWNPNVLWSLYQMMVGGK